MIPPQLPIVSLKTLVFFCRRWEPQQPPRSIVLIKGDAQSQCVVELLSRSFHRPRRKNKKGTDKKKGKTMKKLRLIVLVASGLAFVPVQSSDAQIYVGIPGIAGVGIGG